MGYPNPRRRRLLRMAFVPWVIVTASLVCWSWWDQQRPLPAKEVFDQFRWDLGDWASQIVAVAFLVAIGLAALYGIGRLLHAGRTAIVKGFEDNPTTRKRIAWLASGATVRVAAVVFLVIAYFWFQFCITTATQAADALVGGSIPLNLALALVLGFGMFFGGPIGVVALGSALMYWLEKRLEPEPPSGGGRAEDE